MSRKKKNSPAPRPILSRSERALRIPPNDQALVHHLRDEKNGSATVWAIGHGQISQALADRMIVNHFTMDCWDHRQTRTVLGSGTSVNTICSADWPEEKAGLAVISLERGGSEELALDLFQGAWLSLLDGGRMVVSVDSDVESWAKRNLQNFSSSISMKRYGKSIVLELERRRDPKRICDRRCELAFRDHEKLVRLVTEPGVFAHRKMDNGARQLLNSVELEPNAKVLDIGCGSGAVSLGLAMRDPGTQVVAIDSHARAVRCTDVGAERNGLVNVQTVLNDEGDCGNEGVFDLVMGNPPYYSGFRIARIFCEAAARNLAIGGRAIFVTKTPEWYSTHMPRWFGDVEVLPSGRYHIATGILNRREVIADEEIADDE